MYTLGRIRVQSKAIMRVIPTRSCFSLGHVHWELASHYLGVYMYILNEFIGQPITTPNFEKKSRHVKHVNKQKMVNISIVFDENDQILIEYYIF